MLVLRCMFVYNPILISQHLIPKDPIPVPLEYVTGLHFTRHNISYEERWGFKENLFTKICSVD
uniref:Uncharacterized protein n=1 Tax=Octopus bimaculoides TaxID=37653 RepID=A0A0L8FWE2_OCTBM